MARPVSPNISAANYEEALRRRGLLTRLRVDYAARTACGQPPHGMLATPKQPHPLGTLRRAQHKPLAWVEGRVPGSGTPPTRNYLEGLRSIGMD